MKYFKVVSPLSGPITIDTSVSNYGESLANRQNYDRLLEIITQSSEKYGFPLDIYFTLNNAIALSGNDYLRNFPPHKDDVYNLSFLCTSQNRRDILMDREDLIQFIKDIDQAGISLFDEGNYLWEYIYEKVRALKYPHLPARHQSIFLFETVQDCNYFMNKHGMFGAICQVDIIQQDALFRGDMNIYDEIPNHFSYQQTFDEASRYWDAKVSNQPVYEILFQGKCTFTPYP
ncbi:hypothetical protein AAEO56_06940 [Flavobacterium sp. DGU11]|uniref:DUF4261 domain-containing protein n=1 Tax=Flavobacterium arundinis TaxID=3139143 RepID=A0ABU9HV15_9FLAO